MTDHVHDPDFRAEPTTAGIVGTVTYRCAGCSGTIDGEVAYVAPSWTLVGTLPSGMELGPSTRTYHPHHIPQEN